MIEDKWDKELEMSEDDYIMVIENNVKPKIKSGGEKLEEENLAEVGE